MARGIDPWISIAGLTKDDWRKGVEAWKHLDVTHIAVDTMRAGLATPQGHIDAIRSFREDFMIRIRALEDFDVALG